MTWSVLQTCAVSTFLPLFKFGSTFYNVTSYEITISAIMTFVTTTAAYNKELF